MANQKKEVSKKEIVIIVNGREKVVKDKELTFIQVVGLAFEIDDENKAIFYTVTFKRAHGNKPEGVLVEGDDPVKLKTNMIFNVSATDKS